MADLIRRVFGKLLGGKAAADPAKAKVSPPKETPLVRQFTMLNRVEPALASKTAAFIMDGEPATILSTLSSPAVRAAWGTQRSSPLPYDFDISLGNEQKWQLLSRYGEVKSILEPLGSAKVRGMFGTDASPDWLRHALHGSSGRLVRSFSDLRDLAAVRGAGPAALLDILLHANPNRYRSDNSLDAFPGAEDWLAAEAPAVLGNAGAFDTPTLAELVRAIGRFRLTSAYCDFLVTCGISTSKTIREATVKALTGADPDKLSSHLAQHYGNSNPAARTELVTLAYGTLGAQARTTIEAWQQTETERRPREMIERVLANLRLGDAPTQAGDADGSYVALDGTTVTPPPRQPPPEPSAIPDETYDLLRPAMAGYNARLLADKEKYPNDQRGKNTLPLDEQAFQLFKAQIEGEKAKDYEQGARRLTWLPVVFEGYDRAGVSAFLRSRDVTLRHLVKMMPRYSGVELLSIFSDSRGSEVGAELRRRIEAGADYRVVAAFWSESWVHTPVSEYLSAFRSYPLDEIDPAILWPHIAESFDAIDEAFKLRAQSGDRPFDPARAFDLLGLLPKIPQRYLVPLMGFATGTDRDLREEARRMLSSAPAIDGAIALLLGDSAQEVRAGAADWLAARGARTQIPALRGALKAERGDAGRAAILTALRRLGDDAADYFDPKKLLGEAKAGLAKTSPKSLAWLALDRLPSLRWADGSGVDRQIVQWWVVLANKLKQPGGNALLDLWLDRLATGDAARLGLFILHAWIEQDTHTVSEDEANAFAAAKVDLTIANNKQFLQRYPNYAQYRSTDHATVFDQLKRSVLGNFHGSAADSKGLLALTTHVEGADAALAARAYLKEHSARVSQCRAIVEALAANPAPAAIQIVLATANRFKARTVQEHAATLIEAIAERRGWTAQELADRTIPTAGFDNRGEIELDCGADRTYRLRLGSGEVPVLLNASGTPVKALPSARNDAEGPLIDAAKKLWSTAKKELKLVVPAQIARLHEAMCLERRWRIGDWQEFLLGHPIVGRLVRRLVWIGCDATGNVALTFIPLDDGSFTDHHDKAVSLDGIDQVQIAHSSLLSTDDVAAWGTHLADYEVTSPFDQFGRRLPVLDPAHHSAAIIDDRKGWMIECFKLRSAANRLGYIRGAAGDGGVFTRYERRYDAAGLVAVIEFNGSLLPEENTTTALHDLHFEKPRRRGNYGGAAIKLGKVPPVLLGESWQDLHDIAAAGTGFDADWKRKMPW